MHDVKEGEWFESDINNVNIYTIPRTDCWCAGFPCQDISVSGNQAGLDGERSGLFFALTRLIKKIKEKDRPSYLFLENVKNLLSINKGFDFLRVLGELDEIGYDCQWQLANSKHYGVPQNRERVFIIGYFRGRCTRKVLPITGTNGKALKQIVGGAQGGRVYDPSGVSCTLKAQGGGHGAKTGLYLVQEGINVASSDKVKSKYTDTAKCLLARDYKGIGHLQATTTVHDKVKDRIRRLTPKECFRLQGFPDEYFDKARITNSDTQLYKQIGNSVSMPVIYEIAKRLEVI